MSAGTPIRPHLATEATARILEAAEELFAEHGYGLVSINTIAARAGVSKANVFHHFSSKNDLYLAVLRVACHESSERLARLVSTPGPLAERLPAFAHEQLRDMLQHHRVSRLILRELIQDGPGRGAELAERVFGDNFAQFVAILRGGQQRGELRTDVDPAMVAVMLIGANVFFFEAHHMLRHFRDVRFAADPQRFSAMLVDLLLRGVLPTNPDPRLPDLHDDQYATGT